jgi:A/G-specific adenine glycosylase
VAAGGRLPTEASDLRRLPGVGPYTAAAVASLAFGRPEPVLDGNVMRVVSRVLAFDLDPRSRDGGERIQAWVRELFADGPPGGVNEALMELGATVCTPRAPCCESCPLTVDCRGRALGRPEAFPPARPRRPVEEHRWVAACVIDRDRRWLLRRVEGGPILVGLWLPPFADLGDGESAEARARTLAPFVEPRSVETLPEVRHGITHRSITVLPVRMAVEGGDPPAGWRWADPRDPGVPTSSLLAKLVEREARDGGE